MNKYQMTEELCNIEIDQLEAQIEVLKCKRALFMIDLLNIGQGDDVYVRGNVHASVAKGEDVPAKMLYSGRLATEDEIEELRLRGEISVIFYENLLEEIEEGAIILVNDETAEYQAMKTLGSC